MYNTYKALVSIVLITASIPVFSMGGSYSARPTRGMSREGADSQTLLYTAASQGDKDMVERLSRRVANINQQDRDGLTPLHIAASNGHKDAAQTLLWAGAKATIEDIYGWTPLHCAASKDHATVVGELLKNGAKVSQKDHLGRTALHIASYKGFSATVKELLEATYPHANEQDEEGFTPLHAAVLGGQETIVQLLINKADVQLDITDKKDAKTALHLACYEGYIDIARALITAGADVNKLDKYGQTPLAVARHAAVKTLLKEIGAGK